MICVCIDDSNARLLYIYTLSNSEAMQITQNLGTLVTLFIEYGLYNCHDQFILLHIADHLFNNSLNNVAAVLIFQSTDMTFYIF